MRKIIPLLFALIITVSCVKEKSPRGIQMDETTPGIIPTAEAYHLYFPILFSGTVLSANDGCNTTEAAQRLSSLFVHDPLQRRLHPTCDSRLVAAANWRANDMATRGYFNHLDLDGHSPNYWARKFGCHLPDYFPEEGNMIESIALNSASPELIWQAWLNSSGHRAHVLGMDHNKPNFWADQNDYGFAIVTTSYGTVAVAMTAPDCDQK